MKQFALTLCMVLLSVMFCRAQIKPLKFDKTENSKWCSLPTCISNMVILPRILPWSVSMKCFDAERPDLVVFTGDVVYGKPAETAMRTVLACASSRKILCCDFGNHDNEQDKTRRIIWRRSLCSFIIFSRTEVRMIHLTTLAFAGFDSNRDAALLYCMDSPPYSRLRMWKDMPGLPLTR